jgi:hypothetical protein
MSSMVFQIIILILALGLVSPRGPLDVGHELDWVYVLFIGIQGGAQVTMVCIRIASLEPLGWSLVSHISPWPSAISSGHAPSPASSADICRLPILAPASCPRP